LPRSAAVLQGIADPVDRKNDGKAGETPEKRDSHILEEFFLNPATAIFS
jgi:hypothetical protein